MLTTLFLAHPFSTSSSTKRTRTTRHVNSSSTPNRADDEVLDVATHAVILEGRQLCCRFFAAIRSTFGHRLIQRSLMTDLVWLLPFHNVLKLSRFSLKFHGLKLEAIRLSPELLSHYSIPNSRFQAEANNRNATMAGRAPGVPNTEG